MRRSRSGSVTLTPQEVRILREALDEIIAYRRALIVDMKIAEYEYLASKLVPEPVDKLSRRELQVLKLLDSEKTPAEIALELIISMNTLKTYMRTLYWKLGVHSRREAIRRARLIGLL